MGPSRVAWLVGALLALPGVASADGWHREDRGDRGVGLHLELGGLASDAGPGLAFDLGVRFGPFLATGAYRSVSEAAGRVEWSGARLQWLLLDHERLGIHAGLGAGVLRALATGGTTTSLAVTAGGGVSLLGEGGFNLVGVGVELWLPAGDLAGAGGPRAPVVVAMLLVNPLFLYAMK